MSVWNRLGAGAEHGAWFIVKRRGTWALWALLFMCGWAGGCQGPRPIAHHRLIEHQAIIDFSGLKPAENVEPLRLTAALPQSWEALPPQRGPFYTHIQWRSPSSFTGVGAAYVRLPLPVSAATVVWFAKQEYARKAEDGRILGEWSDEFGRHWFEAENDKYHIRGYALAQGFEAWLIYFGYRVHSPPIPTEIGLAARCVDTFLPLLNGAWGKPAKAGGVRGMN